MTWATAENDSTPTGTGELRLVDPSERTELEATAVAESLLLVPIEPPRPALRGRLALLIESAVEEQLDRRGAPPPGVGASSDLDASLSDQLYRARLVGSSGLCISLHSLEGIANLAGALDAEDSAVLRWWTAATRERPVRLLMAVADRDLGVYGEPVPLAALLTGQASSHDSVSRAPSPAPEVAASTETMELSEAPPAVVESAARIVVRAERDMTPSPPPVAVENENDAEALMRAMAAIFSDEEPSDEAPAVEERPTPFEEDPTDPSSALAVASPVEEASDVEVSPTPTLEPPSVEAFVVDETHAEPTEDAAPSDTVADDEAAPSETADAPSAAREWARWARELEGTRGPKPLAVIERTFVSSFVPLTEALTRGVAGEEARPVAESWAKSFEKSYSEAFDALRVRGKRPTMVLDVPDLALRIGRLHGARSAQLVLVDGMRFDLGVRINERLRPLLGQHAALTERLLLWSALPSTTAMQLELIGRGPQGLRELTDTVDSEVPVARGRAAATLRRVRAGHREVLKLDLVECAMSVPGGPLAERLDDLADETAEALANHILKLPPRTLVVVFGDHGFTVDPVGNGTSAARSGGASPEEVLVPAFAWLVGAVH